MKLGQRFFIFLVVAIVIVVAIFLGAPVDNPEQVVMQMVSPLVIALLATTQQAKVINNRVASGDLEPNDIGALLQMKETWFLFITLGAWLVQRFGLATVLDANGAPVFNVDLFVNALMTTITAAIGGYAERPNGASYEITQVDLPELTSPEKTVE